jgi:putative Mg2+ transporter-C (MgtC) family protein
MIFIVGISPVLIGAVSNWDIAIHQWVVGFGTPVEDFLRLIIAAIAGGMVGLERELRGRQAGFRTYILVCVGSALVMIISTQLAEHDWRPLNNNYTIRVDPGRIAYGVMMGIGFLGAGVIVQGKGGSVRGLTTAAGLWCIAAVGLATGFGMYVLTILATLLILAALWILDYFEDLLPKLRYRTVTVRTNWRPGCVGATVQRFKDGGLRVVDASFERSDDLQYADIHVHIAFVNSAQYYNFERQLEGDAQYQFMATHER